MSRLVLSPAWAFGPITALRAVGEGITGNTVNPTDLILFPCGYLGCSPNGIISVPGAYADGPGILEVKCRFKLRNNNIEEMISNELKDKEAIKGFYLTSKEQLNKDHIYWHQLPGEIAAAKVK